jgi:hypothetical protein
MGRDKYLELQNYYEELSQVDSINHFVVESKKCEKIISDTNVMQIVDSKLIDYCMFVREFVITNNFKNVLILDNDQCIGIAALHDLDCVYLTITPNIVQQEHVIQSNDIVAELSKMVDNNVFDFILINNTNLSHNFSVAFICIDKILKNGGAVMMAYENISERVSKKLHTFDNYIFTIINDYDLMLMVKK